MKNVLILTEKKTHNQLIGSAVAANDQMIATCCAIGGHIYTNDEYYIHLIDKEKENNIKIDLPNGEAGLVIGDKSIKENVHYIQRQLDRTQYDYIVNACGRDKNGNALFEYAYSLLDLSKQKNIQLLRLELNDLSKAGLKQMIDDMIPRMDCN